MFESSRTGLRCRWSLASIELASWSWLLLQLSCVPAVCVPEQHHPTKGACDQQCREQSWGKSMQWVCPRRSCVSFFVPDAADAGELPIGSWPAPVALPAFHTRQGSPSYHKPRTRQPRTGAQARPDLGCGLLLPKVVRLRRIPATAPRSLIGKCPATIVAICGHHYSPQFSIDHRPRNFGPLVI